MFGNKVYELPLSRDYVSKWGIVEAVRELLQNAIDSSSPFDVSQAGSQLAITSSGVKLDPATLVLGRTSKAENEDAIGQFGEGYKLALLVLCREGIDVDVYNGDCLWKPEFRRSSQFGIETMHIVESSIPKAERRDRLQFHLFNLSGDDQQAIKDSCLLMQPTIADAIDTPYGRILPSKPGRLYVGGLFVCKTELEYGYDFNPGEIQLERDRQTVGGFDLKWKTKDVWSSTKDFDTVAALVEKNSPDVSLYQYGAPSEVKEACYRLFVSKHPGAVIAKDREELESLVEKGMTKVVQQNPAFAACVSGSESYKGSGVLVPVQTPAQELAEWYDDNKRYMSRLPSASFKTLMSRAKGWINK